MKKDAKAKDKTIRPNPPSKTDPDGSYTGRPNSPDEVPVQDADDL